jgi:hypothetical protein
MEMSLLVTGAVVVSFTMGALLRPLLEQMVSSDIKKIKADAATAVAKAEADAAQVKTDFNAQFDKIKETYTAALADAKADAVQAKADLDSLKRVVGITTPAPSVPAPVVPDPANNATQATPAPAFAPATPPQQ